MSDRNTLAGHVGKPVTFEALGRSWTAARMERMIWRQFIEEYAKGAIPDPRDTAAEFIRRLDPKLPCYDVACQEIVRAGLDEALLGLSPGNHRVLRLLADIDGASYMLMLLLRKNHSDITHDMAWDIAMSLGMRDLERMLNETQGKAPAPKGGGESPDSPPPAV
jgi:hypothetical protein